MDSMYILKNKSFINKNCVENLKKIYFAQENCMRATVLCDLKKKPTTDT